MTFEKQLETDQKQIEVYLADYIKSLPPAGELIDAMAYSLLSGGKRIRPVLTLEACRLCGGKPEAALPFAAALEMVHTYSLIHDDLPCMDDDDLRRGKPTNHKVYGEATAVLAGDALLTNAFSVLAQAEDMTSEQTAKAVACLASASGSQGMVAGQVLDMDGAGKTLSFEGIQRIESLKTGKLMVAAVTLGAIAANAPMEMEKALVDYAENIGLAFQIQDDILDQQGTEEELGKPIGSDIANEKATFVSLKGIAACEELVQQLTKTAASAIKKYEENGFLCWLAEKLALRSK